MYCTGNCQNVTAKTVLRQYADYRNGVLYYRYVCPAGHPVYLSSNPTEQYSGSYSAPPECISLIGTTELPKNQT